jgi:hypothetical protein
LHQEQPLNAQMDVSLQCSPLYNDPMSLISRHDA